jgi:type IV pilus assembly protein PilN
MTGTSNINLMPNRNSLKNEEKIKFISKWSIILISILFIAIALVTFIGDQTKTEEVNEKLQEFSVLEAERDTKQMKLGELKRSKSEIERILSVSKDVHSNQQFMYAVLQGITSSIPRGVSLTNINYTDGKVGLKGVSLSDQNILGLIERLEQSPEIEQASLLNLSIDKEGKQGMKSFSIRVILSAKKSSALKKG